MAEIQLEKWQKYSLIVHDSERCVLAVVKLPLSADRASRASANFTARTHQTLRGLRGDNLQKSPLPFSIFLPHLRTFWIFSSWSTIGLSLVLFLPGRPSWGWFCWGKRLRLPAWQTGQTLQLQSILQVAHHRPRSTHPRVQQLLCACACGYVHMYTCVHICDVTVTSLGGLTLWEREWCDQQTLWYFASCSVWPPS